VKRTLVGLAVIALALGVGASPAAAPPRSATSSISSKSDTIDCSTFNPAWTFNDDFVDFFVVRGRVWFEQEGEPIRDIGHFVHRSNDVNTGPASRCTSTTTSSWYSTSSAGP
jgi:hypothetical protein